MDAWFADFRWHYYERQSRAKDKPRPVIGSSVFQTQLLSIKLGLWRELSEKYETCRNYLLAALIFWRKCATQLRISRIRPMHLREWQWHVDVTLFTVAQNLRGHSRWFASFKTSTFDPCQLAMPDLWLPQRYELTSKVSRGRSRRWLLFGHRVIMSSSKN